MTRSNVLNLALVLALTSCGGGDGTTQPPTPVPTTVSVTPATSTLNALGATVQLSAQVRDQNGTIMSQAVSWTSSSAGVATVSQNGLVTAVSEGQATITAAAGTASGTATVSVATTPPTVTAVSPATMVEGATATLTGTDFATVPANNVVTVGGEEAQVLSASSTTLTIRVPALCEPTIREVQITVRSNGLPAAPLDHPIGPGAPLAVTDGQQTVIAGGGAVCLQLPDSPDPADYLVGVQSLSEEAVELTSVAFRSIRAPGGVAVPQLVAAPSPSATAGSVLAPLEDERSLRIRDHRRAEARLIARDAEMVNGGAGLELVTPGAAAVGAAVPNLDIGQTLDLKVRDINGEANCSQGADITATVTARTAHSLWLVDDGNPANGFTQSEIQDLAADFESKIYGPHVGVFGEPSDIDNNGRVAIVVTKEINKTNGSEGTFQGFVTACDFFSRASAPASNEGEVFYVLAPDPTGTHGQTVLKESVADIIPFVLAHELTHITQFGQRLALGRSLPAIYHLEGQATFAEEIVGHSVEGNQPGQNYGADVAWDFAEVASARWYRGQFSDLLWWFGGRPNTEPQDEQVPGAPEECGWIGELEDQCISRQSYYGLPWSFLRWASDQFFAGNEAALQRALINSSRTGLDLYESAIGRSREDLFPAWAAALYLDDREDVDRSLSFTSWDLVDVFESGVVVPTGRLIPRMRAFESFTDNVRVRAGSTAYWRISGVAQPATAIRVRQGGGAPLPDYLLVWVVKIPGPASAGGAR
jgi:hypothetical protein